MKKADNMKTKHLFPAASFALVLAFSLQPSALVSAATTITTTNRYAYGANFGWVDACADTNHGAVIGEYVCSGYLYAANVGWINLGGGIATNGIQYQNLGATDFGVNQDGAGNLRGYAWGANVGWVNFENTGAPRVDLASGKLSGYAYSANCGWLSLSNLSAVVQTATVVAGADSDQNGLPDAWERQYFGHLGVDPNADPDHDGMSNGAEYLAGTDPNNGSDNLRITSYARAGSYNTLWWTAKPTRLYSVERRAAFEVASPWETAVSYDVAGKDNAGFDNTGPQYFYRIRAGRPLVPTNESPGAIMVWISPGTFVMGSPTSEVGRYADETQHTVTLTHGFYMGKYEVTQGEYLALMGSNPSSWTGNLYRPVDHVNWFDATNYCGQLTQQEQAAGRLPAGWVYRLPTESEWEYACRAGTTNAFNFGSAIHGGMANFSDYYEYDAASGEIYVSNPTVPNLARTTAVGSYEANAWGLYDMHGNAWEWCQDWYGTYPIGSVTDPQGAASSSWRVARGGAYSSNGKFCRSARRSDSYAVGRSSDMGFRVVLAPGPP
jgi:formylglycine-generating enzyme required for sulfatase activity